MSEHYTSTKLTGSEIKREVFAEAGARPALAEVVAQLEDDRLYELRTYSDKVVVHDLDEDSPLST